MTETPSSTSQRFIQALPGMGEDEISLMEIMATLREGLWTIIAITLCVLLLAGTYALFATPIYQADALLQAENKSNSLGGLSELDTLLTGETPAATEIEIIRSRAVQGKVVEKLHLDIQVSPHYFPVIGDWMARRYSGETPARPFLGLKGFAWGGERISIHRLDVPQALLGHPMTLVALASDRYQLLDDKGEILLEGQVGHTAEGHGISLYLSELVARPGTRFDLKKTGWLTAVKALQETLKVSEKGKKTGVFLLTLEDADADRAVAILNATANIYLRQNVERKSEEAQKALEFLQGQLPKLKLQLETSESLLNDYRLQRGSVDVGLEAQALLDQSAKLEQQVSELKLKKLELRRRFTGNHPVIQSLEDKLGRLQTEQQTLEQRIKALPGTEQEVLRMMRDVKVQTELYTLLLNKTQELEVARAGTIGNVRVLDYAVRPDRPIKPKRALIVALGLVAGAFLGILLVFVRKGLQQGIEAPDEIEKRLGLSVYASVPHSEAQKKLHEQMKKGRGSREYLLARVDDTDLAIESLRSLRTNLHFGMMDADNNRILITGPAPGVGKSFVSANLATVLASAGKRVLLIDADLRKGHLHTYFSLSHKPGLSECIRGDMILTDAVQTTGQDNLHVLSTGAYPPNPSELLMSEAFSKLLNEASTRYDLILIDTPPVLAVTDAVVIGKMVGTAFLLLRAGRHPLGEIQQAQRQLENGGVKIKGVIFNDIQPKRSQYGYYGSYHYAYK